jgi:hypothetical protein
LNSRRIKILRVKPPLAARNGWFQVQQKELFKEKTRTHFIVSNRQFLLRVGAAILASLPPFPVAMDRTPLPVLNPARIFFVMPAPFSTIYSGFFVARRLKNRKMCYLGVRYLIFRRFSRELLHHLYPGKTYVLISKVYTE